MKKEFYLIDAINIVDFFNKLPQHKKNGIPIKVHYALKKAVGKMTPDVRHFEDIRDDEVREIQAKWFTDENTIEYDAPKLDEDGNEVKDENGNVITEAMRRLKDDVIPKYQEEINELEQKLKELVLEKNEYDIKDIDIEDMVNSLPDDTPLENTDIDMLDVIFGK